MVAKQHLPITVCSCHVVVVATETSPLASHVAARPRQWCVACGLTKQILLSHVQMIYDSLSLIEVQLAIRWVLVFFPQVIVFRRERLKWKRDDHLLGIYGSSSCGTVSSWLYMNILIGQILKQFHITILPTLYPNLKGKNICLSV